MTTYTVHVPLHVPSQVITDVDPNVVFLYLTDNEAVATNKRYFTDDKNVLNELRLLQPVPWKAVTAQYKLWQAQAFARHGTITLEPSASDTVLKTRMQRGTGAAVMQEGGTVRLFRHGSRFSMSSKESSKDAKPYIKEKLYGTVVGFVSARERSATANVNSVYVSLSAMPHSRHSWQRHKLTLSCAQWSSQQLTSPITDAKNRKECRSVSA